MSGFFQGGFAEGSMGAQKMALAERAQTEQTELGRGTLGLQERQFGRQLNQDTLTRGDALIAQNMAVVSETIKNAVAVGTPPEKITQTVMPLVQSAQAIAQRIGRDPAALAAQVQAEIARPGAIQVAETGGTATGRAAVAGEAARLQVPLPPAPTFSPEISANCCSSSFCSFDILVGTSTLSSTQRSPRPIPRSFGMPSPATVRRWPY